MASAQVTERLSTSLQKRSQRSDETSKGKSAQPQPEAASSGDGDKPMGDKSSDTVIKILSTIQGILIAIKNFFYHLYLVLKFIWEKPDIAWDLVCTTFHLIKVSRDAGLWSWAQLWDIFYTQTFAPMIRAEKGNVDTAAS
uniref:ADP-ribosylation factor-like protein 6-interacting protein 1 n=1 Tax=Angiostrongylus cantonensis TaxID=6313 RepID=A0A158P6C7_ANGCA